MKLSASHIKARGQGHFCLPLHQCHGPLHKFCLKQLLCKYQVSINRTNGPLV